MFMFSCVCLCVRDSPVCSPLFECIVTYGLIETDIALALFLSFFLLFSFDMRCVCFIGESGAIGGTFERRTERNASKR
jgi:hypothetical protein